MSLTPLLYSDWWEDLDRPHRLWDQYLGTAIDPEDLLNDLDSLNTEVLLYRPHRRARRRYHPFLKGSARKGRGASTVQPDKNKFQVTLDVAQFAPNEINVKVVDQNVVVEAKHEEKEDDHGWVSRQFVRKYIVPSQCDIDQVESHLSTDGILIITAPRKEPLKGDSKEKVVKVQYTGRPALNDYEPDRANESSESRKDQSQQGGLQQHQAQLQQAQQQMHHQQRGRKGIVKAG